MEGLRSLMQVQPVVYALGALGTRSKSNPASTYCCSSRSSPYSRYLISVKSPSESVATEANASFSSSTVNRLRISDSDGPFHHAIKETEQIWRFDIPDEGLKYGFGLLRSSSHVMILVVQESRTSVGMSAQRAANSSLWIVACVRALEYFLARSEPEWRC